MKFPTLPNYIEGGPVRRGLSSGRAFVECEKAICIHHNATTGEDTAQTISKLEASDLFHAHPRAKLVRLPRGPFVLFFATPTGYTRVSLWGVS